MKKVMKMESGLKDLIKTILAVILAVITAMLATALLSACAGGDNVEKDAGSGGVGADAAKWNVTDGLVVGFFSETDCPLGNIEDGKSKRELNARLNERYYMVADFAIQAPQDNDGKENVTAVVNISPASAAAATIQETNTGNVNEQTADGATVIKAVYKIPDRASVRRKIRIVVRIDAVERGVVEIDLKLNCPLYMTAVTAKGFNKQVVFGYNEDLIYENDKVVGITDKTAKKILVPSEHNGTLINGFARGAFAGCDALESIALPFLGAELGGYKNTHFGWIFGAETYSDNASSVPASLKEVFPYGATRFEGFAFFGCGGLTYLNIPDGVIYIGQTAFTGCDNLIESVDGVNYIGKTAVGCDSSLTALTFKAGTEKIATYAFSGQTALTSVIFPDSVTSIGYYAFFGCSGLKSVTIPNGVTELSGSNFAGCSGLESITFGSGLKHIVSQAFMGCSSLTEVTIPDGVVQIGAEVFARCSKLKTVTIPVSVASILHNAFYRCEQLSDIYYKGMESQWYKVPQNGWADYAGKYTVHFGK